jgi:hypothetical protein
MFTTIEGLLDYAPTYKAYHYRLLEELYEDNVQYVELRSGFSGVSSFFSVECAMK